MAPAYKLIYFNARGIAEGGRFLLKYGDIDFEDIRIKDEDWPQMKDKFGRLPVLEHDGKQVGQSMAISRYLGKLVKLAGNDDWENLEIDAIVDTIHDVKLKVVAVRFEQDEVKRNTMREKILKEILPYYMSLLDGIVKKNDGYLALGRLTWADLYFVGYSPAFDAFLQSDSFENYPNLKALRDKVNAIPAIQKWLEVRPITEK